MSDDPENPSINSTPTPAYAELQVASNYSFLRGASHPHELIEMAGAYGLAGIALTDRNSLAGVVRGHVAAKEQGLTYLVGCRIDLRDGSSFLAYPTDINAYARLSHLLTLGKRRAPKGECWLNFQDLADHASGLILALVVPYRIDENFAQNLQQTKQTLPDHRLYLALSPHYRGDDARRFAQASRLADQHQAHLLATNDVHAHQRQRRPLQDVLTCIREGCTIEAAGYRLFANGERHLKSPARMAEIFADYPEALAHSLEILNQCHFSLDELSYQYPTEEVGNETPQQRLHRLTYEGAQRFYPNGLPEKVAKSLTHELSLIERLRYAPYFLTVHDIVLFARSQGILCQGRGSAANSAVCYCLGVTAVDPATSDLLFERFISEERGEPPDIDVDFEHERREEVIQHIYRTYGRERAGLCATVICYRGRSAMREVGKVFGLSPDVLNRLAGMIWRWGKDALAEQQIKDAGLDPQDPQLAMIFALARELVGFPRHLSQHVGGFVITRGALSDLCPIHNAAMVDRTCIEWDKDDIDALKILKIDILALGMLSCIRKAFTLLDHHHHRPMSLVDIPPEDEKVYDMLCRGDAVGVFQVESRAQMAMLPRLRPRCFYDLVIEVAIVRPGPIQGDMVHPFLRRRRGQEPVEFPSEELRQVLGKTLGVPLFQEQAMKIAIVAAGFSPSEADKLRRAMATFRKTGLIHTFREKFINGMVSRGYQQEFADRCFSQIEGFGEYGFPESHAASFALLVYVSAWLKHHYPAAFACALLNSQPMGFYAPAQIVRDAQEHGVKVNPIDVNKSAWDNLLEPDYSSHKGQALRLGFRQIKGFREADALEIAAARATRPFADPYDLALRAGITPAILELLARADAFAGIGLNRRQTLWEIRRFGAGTDKGSRTKVDPPPLFAAAFGHNYQAPEWGPEKPVLLPEMSLGEEVIEDFASLRLSLKAHPLALLRDQLQQMKVVPHQRLSEMAEGKRCLVAGLVVVRQRPGTASGTVFVTLEDETGIANLVVWPKVFEKYRAVALSSSLLGAEGRVQRDGDVLHLVTERLINLSPLLQSLTSHATIQTRPHQPHPRATGLVIQTSRSDEFQHPTYVVTAN